MISHTCYQQLQAIYMMHMSDFLSSHRCWRPKWKLEITDLLNPRKSDCGGVSFLHQASINTVEKHGCSILQDVIPITR